MEAATLIETRMEEQVVKSRHRVKVYGEVFTPRHMVNQMLDLVGEDLETGSDFVNKTFLEPAAGDGNFLVAILHRKLRAIEKRVPREDWRDASLFAVASIYGIELLGDNHREAKEAMLGEFLRFHEQHGVPCAPKTNLYQAAAFLIATNIVQGDTLSGRDARDQEIQFSWWKRVDGAPAMVQREPFTFASLRASAINFVMDFTVYENYAACRIDQVHNEVKTDA